ncbi:MAG: hypothetical protein ACI4I6_07515 [Hominimerdicola sp.]
MKKDKKIKKECKNKKNQKFTQLLILCSLCLVPIISITSCGIKQSYKCSSCGSSDTYTPIYASGVEEDTDIEYTSCVGPAGCLGCGLNTSCWPTECEQIKFTDNDGKKYEGMIYYYDGFGCIGKNDTMSYGKYDVGMDCGFFNCNYSAYNEEVNNDGTRAYTGPSCLGISCNEEPVDSMDYNNNMPRKFKHGCVSACYDE